ncbi:MAG: two-component regulator propeller domain-containing protein [Flavobacteriales bacterium]
MRSYILLATVLLALHGYGQRFFFENLGVQQGLPASKVYAMIEDEAGKIWIGDEAGISRFDGITVRAFGTKDGVAPNGARALHIDGSGRLWAGHLGGGITLLDGAGSLRTVRPGNACTSDITGITEDARGTIWLSTFGQGAIRIADVDAQGRAEAVYFGEPEGIQARLTGIFSLKDGSLLAVDASGRLVRLTENGERFEPYPVNGLPEVQRVTTLYEDTKGRLWVGTFSGGVFRHDPATGKTTSFDITNGLPENFVFSLGEDADGRIWVGTWEGGIARVQEDGIRIFNTGNGLHGNSIRCMLRDREGNMLIGTNENGLDIFKGERFITFTDADGLVDPQVWAVMQDRQGRIWFGTNGGISIHDPSERSTARVKNLTMQQGDLTSNQIRSLVQDRKGNVWIGTENGGLFEFDPRTFRFRYDLEISGSIPENKVTALALGPEGELWVGTINGLIRYVPGNLPTVYGTTEGLAGMHVVSAYCDTKGAVWVGSTLRGITRIEQGIATPVSIGRSFTATCFVMDKEGRTWVGTEGQGVFVLQNDKVVAEYTTADGLLSNSIRSLNIDKEGQVWLGSNRGLNTFQAGSGRSIAFTERSGYTGIESKPNATCVASDGALWFGTANGATRISTSRASEQLPPPLVAINGLRVNMEERPMDEDLSLDHSERSIRITYGSVSLSDPAAVQYRYKLDGLESDWQPPTTGTDINYPALPPGSYTFQVKAMNRSGIWSDPPAEFSFTILPPWYRSWWFYTSVAGLIAIGLFSYIKVRERQLRMRNAVLERKVTERTAEVVAQSAEIAGQKVRIEELLLNILPKEISEELKEKGKATARRHEHVTVMFTDMKGFTRVAERMTPEELVNELDECFIQFDSIIGRYGIEKIKTIGDSYMCAAGVPSPDPHHAWKSALAALEVRSLMERWKREREAAGKVPWTLRIGLHSGPVVAGVVGKRKFAYDIWGDAVNTASRMESSGVTGEVNISGATHALIKDRFECEHRGEVEAKNKGLIDMYFVRRIRPAYSADAAGTLPNEAFLREIGSAVHHQELA